jgi:hypothetical protein
MSTNVRTAKSSYVVTSVDRPATGPHFLVVRQPSGKARKLGVKDVGRPRFDSAVAHFDRPSASA